MKIRFSVAFVFIIINACAPDQKAVEDNPFVLEKGERPLIIAHGGAKELFPENTIQAFEGVTEIGVDVLEMDIRLTKDGILITHHDETVDRMSDGTGKVIDHTLEEMEQLNMGFTFEDIEGNMPYKDSPAQIATLETIFERFGDYTLNIELKDKDQDGYKAADELYRLLTKHGMTEQVLIASFHDDVLSYFYEISEGTVFISTAKGETTTFVITGKTFTGMFYFPEAVAVQIPMKQSGLNLATRRVIGSAHNHNMGVHYWTINDPEDMEKLINRGADGLITDRPDLMRQVLIDMGYSFD